MDPREKMGFYFAFIFLGLASMAINGVVVFSIAGMKNLKQQRWLLLSATLIMADLMLSFGYTIPSVVGIDNSLNQRLIRNYSIPFATYTNLECTWVNIVQIAFSLFDLLVVLSIAIERLLALSRPVWYFEHSNKLVKSLLGFCILIALMVSAYGFIGIQNKTVTCGLNEGLQPNFKQVYYATISCVCCLVLFFCSLVLFITWRQLRKLKLYQSELSNDDAKMKQMRKQLKITNTIAIILAAFFCTAVPSYTIIVSYNFMPTIITDSNTRVRVMFVCQLLVVLNTFLNSFLYTWRNSEIREAVLEALHKIGTRRRDKMTSALQMTHFVS